MPIVRTVTGDIDPQELGFTYLHEHLIGAETKPDGDPDLTLDDESAAIDELKSFYDAGGRGLVEMTPKDHSRNPRALKRISEGSRVHIIGVTGFIKGASAQPFVEGKTVHQLADEMIRDVTEGIGDTGIRAGVIKAGSSRNEIKPIEENVFRAAAIAHRETGAPISTHTDGGTMALEQIAMLRSDGVSPERMLIGHLDRHMDWEYHLAVANTGVYFGYDQFSKAKYYPDELRVEYVVKMVQAGFRDQLALSGDLAKRSNFPSYGFEGAPGYTHIISRVVPMLLDAGLTQSDVDAIFVDNPARLLAQSASRGKGS
jgi:predicted metal-dependent phosphotriesterase family hydrolase